MDDIFQDITETPCVSVIVPIYNTEQYLPQCVESLLNQTLKNIEIILVDDGSTDKCPALCDAYAEQDPRVKVFHQQNSGYGKACNVGFDAVRGEYLGIVESDDYAELNMLERLYDLAKSHTLDVVRCHFNNYYTRTNTKERIDQSGILQNTICKPLDTHAVFFQPPAVWSMLFRSVFINENDIRFLETPGASYQDTSFVFKVYICANRFMLIDDTLIHYRMDNNNSSSNSKTKMYCVCNEYAEIERFIKEKDLYENLAYIIPKLKLTTYMWNYRRLDEKYRWSFIKVFSQEMRRHIAQKVIRKNHLSVKDTLKIHMIAFLYPLYYFILYIMLKE